MNTAKAHPYLLSFVRGNEASSLLSSTQQQPDWPRLIEQAEVQGLLPLLYRRLLAPAAVILPGNMLALIKERAAAVTARNMGLAQELAAILRECAVARVRCVPLRGLALAEQLHGDLGSRPMGDLDLLVRQEDLSKVGEILRGLGFTELDRRPGFSMTFSNTLEFFKDRHGWVIVEPHWTIAYPPFSDRLKMEPVWDRCVKGSVMGIETWLLSREDLFLHLCFHLIHRGADTPLLWFYELDVFLQRHSGTLDWSWILESAVQTGQGTFLATIFERVTHLLGSPIPDWVVFDLNSRLESQSGAASAGRLELRLTRMLAGNSHVDGLESFALLFAIKGLRRKLRYVFALAFPSAEFMCARHGSLRHGRLGLYYLARLLFLLREGLKGVRDLTVHRRKSNVAWCQSRSRVSGKSPLG